MAPEHLTKDRFVKDAPKKRQRAAGADENWLSAAIDGCRASPLVENRDHRGDLTELLTTRDGGEEPIVHVYQVRAGPRSLRGWVYHARQTDRLAFTRDDFVSCSTTSGRTRPPTAGSPSWWRAASER
jgi:hypothetical protein